jgi:ketosteroid isomerase-like protein
VESVDLVREIYERFRADDVEGGLALLDPDIEVRERPELPDPHVYRGHEGVVAAVGANRAEFDEADLVPEEFTEAGDQVVVRLHFVGRGRVSGFRVDEPMLHVWTVRDAKAVRLEVRSADD